MNHDNNEFADLMSPGSPALKEPALLHPHSAWQEHIPFAFWLIEHHRPKTIVELGVHTGPSYCAFCQAVSDLGLDSKCHGVDTFKGDVHAGEYDGVEVLENLRAHHDPLYSGFSTLIPATFDEALGRFSDGSIDLLHIDGRHFYEDVKHDFETWLPKLSHRAIVILHDTNERGHGFGVYKFWAEIAAKYPSFEFFHGHGLGVLAVGGDMNATMARFFSSDDSKAAILRQTFAMLGSRLPLKIQAQRIPTLEQMIQNLKEEVAAKLAAFNSSQDEQEKLQQEVLLAVGQLEEAKTGLSTLQIDHAARIQKLEIEFQQHESVRHEQFKTELQAKQERIEGLGSENARLVRAVESMEKWQQSWLRRAFHRWHPPGTNGASPGFLRRLERSIRRWRKEVFNQLPERPVNTQEPPPQAIVVEANLPPLEAEKPQPAAAAPPIFCEEAKIIRESGLFDEDWYRAHYGGNLDTDEDPALHYLSKGAERGFNPGPGFNTRGYLDLYPDVAGANMNPVLHYVRYGKAEERIPNPMDSLEAADEKISKYIGALKRLDARKKTVILVTHQLSRTGAPILVLNMARQLRRTFNIIIVATEGGNLEEEFAGACDIVMGPFREQGTEKFFIEFFRKITAGFPVAFAVVNSIESTIVLKPLWENDIPCIHLIHEFASYTRPLEKFIWSEFYSSMQIYSASIVRQSALSEVPLILGNNTLVLPQGMCKAPGTKNDRGNAAAEQERIRGEFRPPAWPRETVVVLGLGTIQIRKGVDLFIACAKRVMEKKPATPFRFVWIGHDYTSQGEQAYSVYLKDAIQRSGLEEIVAITDEVAEIETAYLESDILFLSSRLDPLPLVSLDAMSHGKPVVCFEKATGAAEYLAEDPQASFGVVPFLDVEVAADRICRLIDDPSLRREVGDAGRRLTGSRFSMENYLNRITGIGMELAARKETEKKDHLLISSSHIFRQDFFCPPGVTYEDPIKDHLRPRSRGMIPRKPFPGFHPGFYSEHQQIKDRNPLAHYIEAGRPAGPWNFEIIEADGPPASGSPSLKAGVHLHLYYPDMAREILKLLESARTRMDLLISVCSKEAAEAVKAATETWSGGLVDIRVVPNRGRDIGPFLTEFKETIPGYDIMGHIHTKKSAHIANDQELVRNWVQFLYKNLLGDGQSMADAIISRMESDKTIGLVFPDDPHVIGWDRNWDFATVLADRLRIKDVLAKYSLNVNFPVGTMFWARPAALKPLFDLHLDWNDYPLEPVGIDGSMLHAIERLLPVIAESAGFRNVVTNVRGVTR